MELTTKEYRKGLSKRESFLISSLANKDKSIFNIEDAKKIVKENTKKTMHSLIRKKWVLPLKRGLYVIVPLDIGVRGADSFIIHNFVISSLLTEPYYIGFWSALNYHGLSDQIPKTTFIASMQAKKPLNILNSTYYFVKLEEGKFFDIETIEVEGRLVNISSLNKTVADCLDHPEHSGGIDEIAKAIYFSHQELDFKKIREYAFRMGNLTILKRLGYILDRTGLLKDYKEIFKDFILSKGYTSVDPISPKRGRYNTRWGLLINCELNPEGWMY